MIEDLNNSAGFEQTEFQSAELAVLRKALTASAGQFSLSLATCNSPALRDYLISTLRADDPNIEVIEPPSGTTEILNTTRELASDPARTALFIVGLEASLPSTDSPGADNASPQALTTLHTLNASRDMWSANFSCPVVFWLGEYASTYLALHAPDFSSWISHRFQFVSEQATASAGMADTFAGNVTAASNLTRDQKHIRLAELESRIADAGAPPPKQLAAHVAIWLYEAGGINATLGNLEPAEGMFREALEIDQKLMRHGNMAADYGCLGVIYLKRGDLDRAEDMQRKALEINEGLGLREGMAANYGNLGTIHQTRGDLDRAEEMLRKALEINEMLGRREGMGYQYGNLGTIYRKRGDSDRAEEMLRKALEINEMLGRREGMANQYGNLGAIYQERGDLDRAEEMLRTALRIDEELGRREGMAIAFFNLGIIYETRGDQAAARRLWTKSLNLYSTIGVPHMVEKVQASLDALDDAGTGDGSPPN